MHAFWLLPRLFTSSLFAGWLMSVLCLLLIAKMPGGLPALSLIWLSIAWAKWQYTLTTQRENTAFLHNLLLSKRTLWFYVACYEALPWLAALIGLMLFA